MKISMIAAIGKNYELGKNNDLLWHLDGDLPFFKKVTMGKPVIMGANTFRSLPKALPGRQNIVITTHPEQFTDKGVLTAGGIREALEKVQDADEVFIIGGAGVYAQFIDMADTLYLTEALACDDTADVYFPRFDKNAFERLVLDAGGTDIPYEHALYTRKK